MSDRPFNPNDPLFLASRSMDERLTDDEQRRLAEWLREDLDAARQMEELRKADRLIRKWGRVSAELPSGDVADLVVPRLTKESRSDERGGLDQLLERYGQSQPEVDWGQFQREVVVQIEQSSQRKRVYRWPLRVGVPLAAAAAVVFAVLVMRDETTIRESVVEVAVVEPTIDRVPESVSVPDVEPDAPIVAFVRTRDEAAAPSGKSAAKGFMVIQSSGVEQVIEDAPPI